MTSKRKGRQPGAEDIDVQNEPKGTELARYVPPVPDHVKGALGEFFRTLGVDVEFDQEDRTYAVSATFEDGSEIYVTGGNLGAEIGCRFRSNIPTFVFDETLLRAIGKTVYKKTMLAKFGYFHLPPSGGGHPFPDIITVVKSVDTTNEKLVMQDVRRIAKILGHHNERRGGARGRK